MVFGRRPIGGGPFIIADLIAGRACGRTAAGTGRESNKCGFGKQLASAIFAPRRPATDELVYLSEVWLDAEWRVYWRRGESVLQARSALGPHSCPSVMLELLIDAQASLRLPIDSFLPADLARLVSRLIN